MSFPFVFFRFFKSIIIIIFFSIKIDEAESEENLEKKNFNDLFAIKASKEEDNKYQGLDQKRNMQVDEVNSKDFLRKEFQNDKNELMNKYILNKNNINNPKVNISGEKNDAKINVQQSNEKDKEELNENKNKAFLNRTNTYDLIKEKKAQEDIEIGKFVNEKNIKHENKKEDKDKDKSN